MATRSNIVQKAYKCLDEIYPDSQLPNEIEEFRVADFVDDAMRFIGRVAPVRALGAGEDFSLLLRKGNKILLPAGFVRLIAFKMSDWVLPVTDALYSDDPRYRQQANSVLKGTPKRPIVFICEGGKSLEYYSSATDATVATAQAFVVDDSEDIYPEQLSDVIAWKTAELVLSAMNDAQGVQFAQNQIQQQLQAL